MTTTQDVTFSILGPLAVEVAQEPCHLSASRHRSILASLLLNANKEVSAEQLAEQVWNQDPPPGAITTLHSYVSRLRSKMGPAGKRIETRNSGYSITVAGDELDILLFARLRDEAQRASASGDMETAARALQQALELWRGLPLADVGEGPWREEAIRYWNEQHLLVLEESLDLELRLDRHASAVPRIQLLHQQHPFREVPAALLIRALGRSGRRSEALAEYRRIRKLFIAEIGVEPGTALQAAHQSVLQEDVRKSAQGAHPQLREPAQLPSDIPDFVGRREELRLATATIALRPADSPPAVVVVSGPGGIGKTTFAVHLGHTLGQRFPHGRLFVRLGGLRAPRHPNDVAAEILRSLGMTGDHVPHDLEQRSALLRTVLASRRVLLVLDDAVDSAQVRPLLPSNSPSSVIITSRRRLAALTDHVPVSLGTLPHNDAQTLLRLMVGDHRVEAEPTAVTEVVRVCAGLPIALRICGARLLLRNGWDMKSFASRLLNTHSGLNEFAVEDLAVRECLDDSYQALQKCRAARGGLDPARAFRLLSLVGGEHFSLPAAAAALGVSWAAADSAVEQLMEMTLLDASDTNCFRFHPLIRELAQEHSEASDTVEERADVLRRWTAWCLSTAAAANRHINTEYIPIRREQLVAVPEHLPFADREGALAWFDRESGSLVEAVRAASALEEHSTAALLPLVLLHGFRVRGRISEIVDAHLVAIRSARLLGDPELLGVLLNDLSIAYGSMQRFDEAISGFEAALRVFDEAGLVTRVAQAQVNIAISVKRRGDLEPSIRMLESAVERLTEIEASGAGDPVTDYLSRTTALALAQALTEAGRTDEARALFPGLIASAERTGQSTIQALAWSNLAILECETGRFAEALPCVQQALDLQRSSGNLDGEAHSLWVLGDIRLGLGDVDGTYEAWQAACRIYETLGETHDLEELRQEISRLPQQSKALS